MNGNKTDLRSARSKHAIHPRKSVLFAVRVDQTDSLVLGLGRSLDETIDCVFVRQRPRHRFVDNGHSATAAAAKNYLGTKQTTAGLQLVFENARNGVIWHRCLNGTFHCTSANFVTKFEKRQLHRLGRIAFATVVNRHFNSLCKLVSVTFSRSFRQFHLNNRIWKQSFHTCKIKQFSTLRKIKMEPIREVNRDDSASTT